MEGGGAAARQEGRWVSKGEGRGGGRTCAAKKPGRGGSTLQAATAAGKTHWRPGIKRASALSTLTLFYANSCKCEGQG